MTHQLNILKLAPFPSLKSAIEYKKSCPFCFGHMEIDFYDTLVEKENGKLIFDLDHNSSSVMYLDINTEEVQLVMNRKMAYQQSYTVGATSELFYKTLSNTHHITIGAISGYGLNVSCTYCRKYSYGLQVWVKLDIPHSTFCGAYLNSETISYKDNKSILHEIKNVYSTEKTHYSYGHKNMCNSKSENVVLPLMALDLVNPAEMVERLRNLLIFS